MNYVNEGRLKWKLPSRKSMNGLSRRRFSK